MSDLKPKSPTDLKLAQVWGNPEPVTPPAIDASAHPRIVRVEVQALTEEQKNLAWKGRDDVKAWLTAEP